MRQLAMMMACFGAVGCVSNPTPHPAGDALVHETRVDAATPSAEPDLNDDGVPDCSAAGGTWDGVSCLGEAAVADGGDAKGDVETDGDAGEVGSTDAADTDEVSEGEASSDAGPDAVD